MAKRKIVCPCGHLMTAADDGHLFAVVRRHVDDVHPDLGYSDDQIRGMISDEASDV